MYDAQTSTERLSDFESSCGNFMVLSKKIYDIINSISLISRYTCN